MIGRPYIRKKADKYIIEQKIEGKTKYIVTLPPIDELINMLASNKASIKASNSDEETKKKAAETFAQLLLSELPKQDAKPVNTEVKHKPTQEEIDLLYELTK